MNTSWLTLTTDWSGQLAMGLLLTIGLATCSIVFGTILGLAAALLSARRIGLLRRAIAVYEGMIRSLPELLVIFAAYYGFAFLLQAALTPFGFTGFIAIDAFWAGVLALSMVHAAFCSDVFRGAFAAVPMGPIEAAQSLGLRPWQVFCLVKLPLSVRFGLPGWMNLAIVSLKLTPLAAAIGLQDLLRTAGDAGRSTHEYLLFYLFALAIYLVLAAGIGLAQHGVERRSHRGWAG